MYENYWPRAVIFDFYCDPSAGVGTPQYLLEYPSYTYKGKDVACCIEAVVLQSTEDGVAVILHSALRYSSVRWPSAYACPVSTNATSCPLYKFAPTWDVSTCITIHTAVESNFFLLPQSLRFRPRPSWYDNVKFGIFSKYQLVHKHMYVSNFFSNTFSLAVHWGIFR